MKITISINGQKHEADVEPRLLLVYAKTAIGYGGTFIPFTFLASILTDISGTSGRLSDLIYAGATRATDRLVVLARNDAL